MSEESFIPEDYKAPTSGFMKFKQGANKIRILSNPLFTWTVWLNDTCHRYKFELKNKPAKGSGEKDSVQHGWLLKVWNYNENEMQVLEITQKGIQQDLWNYSHNPAWGHPKTYDITITKTGEGDKSKYTCMVDPHNLVGLHIEEGYKSTPIHLSNMLIGKSPFENNIPVQGLNDNPNGGAINQYNNPQNPVAQDLKRVMQQEVVQPEVIPAIPVTKVDEVKPKDKLPF